MCKYQLFTLFIYVFPFLVVNQNVFISSPFPLPNCSPLFWQYFPFYPHTYSISTLISSLIELIIKIIPYSILHSYFKGQYFEPSLNIYISHCIRNITVQKKRENNNSVNRNLSDIINYKHYTTTTTTMPQSKTSWGQLYGSFCAIPRDQYTKTINMYI